MANWAPLSGVPELSTAGSRGPAPGSAGPAAAGAVAAAGPSPFGEFLAFRRMVTPIFIQVIFWLGVAVSVLTGLGQLAWGFHAGSIVAILSILSALFTIVVGALLVRVWCELIILLFRIYETLQEIKEQRK